MTHSPDSEMELYRNTISELSKKGRDIFFPWFDGGKNANDALQRAENTFRIMMLPWAIKYTDGKTGGFKYMNSLDIGYGGGGQLLCASSIFKTAFGIDVHNSNELLLSELNREKINNVFTYMTDGAYFPLSNNCIHFAHSWAVFMHLGTMDRVRTYLRELYRVLTIGGIAVIYFSRLIRSKQSQTLEEYRQDTILETENNKGYNEKQNVPVNQINLKIALWRMMAEAKHVGFNVLSSTSSFHTENNKPIIKGQHGVIVKKEAK